MQAMPTAQTIIELLANGSDEAAAIAAIDRPALTYAGLRRQVGATIGALNSFGIGRGDPVAIVLPNGPEMAAAFVGVAAGTTAAPLNPAYRSDEFDFYLSDLGAKALIVQAGSETPARPAAKRHGIQVIELTVPTGAPAGVFQLSADDGGAAVTGGPAGIDDVALVLHTSGTTSRPKIVPLSQRNLCASAASIARAIALTATDRCLNVMPLFHIHGLMAAVLATLGAGASAISHPRLQRAPLFRLAR